MRVLGLARLLRAVCRRWLGGLIVVDDVQLSVFTGELELVDCELDGPKLTKLLARVGLRCRVVNARAAKAAEAEADCSAHTPGVTLRSQDARSADIDLRRGRSASIVPWMCSGRFSGV